MKFIGIQCEHCKNTFTPEDDVVVCPKCGSPHHRACWAENNACANEALHGEGFSWKAPEEQSEKKKTAIPFPHGAANKDGSVICPNCSAKNNASDRFCVSCNGPLTPPVNPDGFREIRDTDQYAYHKQHGDRIPNVLIDGIPSSEYADYIGEKKSETYIRKFLSMEETGRKISVSICAFLFGPIWFFYRKMFKEGLIFLLVFLLFTGIQTWCSVTDSAVALYKEMGDIYSEVMENGELSQEELDRMNEELAALEEKYAGTTGADSFKSGLSTAIEIANTVFVIAAAFFADYLYKRKIVKEIHKIRLECSDMGTYRQTLRQRGGTSVGGAVIAVIALGLISLISFIPAYVFMISSLF